ncbi:TDT family transporter [Streptomyces sp. NPDC005227]|uniref:SLAC1 family transporter n=1 Tax=Streptomyces sp. NPDC005227 TaxID=3364707 RepID=UPI0036CDA378
MKNSKTSPYRLVPNLYGISFGVAGLAQAWTLAHATISAPAWIGNTLWICAAALWVLTSVKYVGNAHKQGRLHTELADATSGPFVSLAAIMPMLLGVALEPYSPAAGKSVYIVGLVSTVVVGGWLTGAWIRSDTKLAQWHPGYFLPTVGGGLLAAGGSAALGWSRLSQIMFGYGLICWLVLGSILLARLFTQAPLPTPLVPTIAIELAPPVVAGNAWFTMTGGRIDIVVTAFAGYAILMGLVQISMFSTYRKVPFGPGYWAFAFSYAAGVTNALHWVSAENVSGVKPISYAILALATCALVALSARTAVAITRKAFFPRIPAPSHP